MTLYHLRGILKSSKLDLLLFLVRSEEARMKRIHRIQAAANEQERAALQLLAADKGVTESEAMRTLIREAAVSAGLWKIAKEMHKSPLLQKVGYEV